jgi:hypothetical protein
LQSYRIDMERRCARCDDGLCSFCAVEIETDWVCVGCKEDPRDGARDVES